MRSYLRTKCYGSTPVFHTGSGSSTLPVRTYKTIASLCNGSMADFEPVGPGSNPGEANRGVRFSVFGETQPLC